MIKMLKRDNSDDEIDSDEEDDHNVPEDEIKLIELFLEKFIFTSESANS
jgi:hypothetical protein